MGSIRTILTNIAQILLIFIIFPIFALICEPLNNSSSVSGLINFLGQVDLISAVSDILSQLTGSVTSNDIADITLWTFFKEFPATIIAGISVHFCISLFNRMWDPIRATQSSFKPLPILPGFLGIALSVIITNIIGLTGSDFVSFLIEIGVIIIMFLGIRLMVTAKWGTNIFSIKTVLLWIIEGIYAIIVSVYVAGMMMIMQGIKHDNVIGFVVLLSTITLIASLLVFFTRLGVKADEA